MRYLARRNAQGDITAVESYSHESPVVGAETITKTEYETFINSLPSPEPARDIISELDKLKDDVESLMVAHK